MTPAALLTRPEPHPILPVFTAAEIDALLATPEGAARYVHWLNTHNERIRLAEEQPLEHGWEPATWKLADEQLAQTDVLALFGANRTGKSYWCGSRFCQAAWQYSGGVLVALSEKEETSVATQQKIVWHYLKEKLEPLNNKRHAKFKINYTQAGGFTEGKLVLPNYRAGYEGTEIYFLTYKQIATDYEGWEFGARVAALSKRPDGSVIENIGWWGDESLTVQWMEVLCRRGPFRKAKGLWSFTPVRGITPGVKEFKGPKEDVVLSAPAELLPNARIDGCPRGHMPVVTIPFQRSSLGRTRAVYFHLGANPFGGYTAEVKRLCKDKTTEYVERVAYGYARDSVNRQFANFQGHNIIPASRLPAGGTNYRIVDPADVRPFFVIWVRVKEGLEPGKPEYFIYRDWPDEQTFGEWAVTTERETSEDTRRGWDGDPGPAQANPNLGIGGYKKVWKDVELVRAGGPVERDPYRRALQVALSARSSAGATSVGLRPEGELTPAERADTIVVAESICAREDIFESIIDSRAGPRAHLAEEGQTCTVWQFEEEHTDSQTGETLPPISFRMAQGDRIDLNLIKDLLEFRKDEDGKLVQHPRLYVSEDCKQVIWALSNYTGKAGEAGACKDVIDCLRYMAGAQLIEITATTFGSRGGGSY